MNQLQLGAATLPQRVSRRPRAFRRPVSEPFPSLGMLNSTSSEALRTSPAVLKPAANSALFVLGRSRIRSMETLSGKSGSGSYLVISSPSARSRPVHLGCPLHRRRVQVLHLDPVIASAAAVGAVTMLRDKAFEAHPRRGTGPGRSRHVRTDSRMCFSASLASFSRLCMHLVQRRCSRWNLTAADWT